MPPLLHSVFQTPSFRTFLSLYMSQLGLHWEESSHYRDSKGSLPSPTIIISLCSLQITVINSLLHIFWDDFLCIFMVLPCDFDIERQCLCPSPWIWAGSWQKKFFVTLSCEARSGEARQSLHCLMEYLLLELWVTMYYGNILRLSSFFWRTPGPGSLGAVVECSRRWAYLNEWWVLPAELELPGAETKPSHCALSDFWWFLKSLSLGEFIYSNSNWIICLRKLYRVLSNVTSICCLNIKFVASFVQILFIQVWLLELVSRNLKSWLTISLLNDYAGIYLSMFLLLTLWIY